MRSRHSTYIFTETRIATCCQWRRHRTIRSQPLESCLYSEVATRVPQVFEKQVVDVSLLLKTDAELRGRLKAGLRVLGSA